MLLIPALDLKNNCCVRLKKGFLDKFFIFSHNPLLVINKWINYDAKRIHLVDLDGAFQGKPKNLFIIKSILNFINNRVELQIGGGIRSLNIINYYFDLGVNYIVLGTEAVLNFNFLEYICFKYPNKIILSLDFKDKFIGLKGWVDNFRLNIDFFKKINKIPLDSILSTDILKDGMLSGMNISMFLELSKFINKPILASGGLSNLDDLKILFDFQKIGLLGLICGKSIYNGNLNFLNLQKKIIYLNSIYI